MHSHYSRRELLKLGLASYGTLMSPINLASAVTNKRLVVIVLRGAMDGLDIVRPVGDPNFNRLRPKLSTDAGSPLDDYYQLHPLASTLIPLWKEESLGFVHAVSTPYRDKRSHFEGQDFLECGLDRAPSKQEKQSGWLNRLLSTIPSTSPRTGFSVAREGEIILSGSSPVTRWFPKTHFHLSTQGRQLLEEMYQNDSLLYSSASQAFDLLEESRANKNQLQAPPHLQIADFLAKQLLGETRIASFSINGWDTHKHQQNAIRRPLRELTDCILHMRSTLGTTWRDTTIVAISEFGRTARENGSFGTDHGTGGLMILAGGLVRGGKVYGRWPGLDEPALYQQRDLQPTADTRSYLAGMARNMFGLNNSQLRFIFPNIELPTQDQRVIG